MAAAIKQQQNRKQANEQTNKQKWRSICVGVCFCFGASLDAPEAAAGEMRGRGSLADSRTAGRGRAGGRAGGWSGGGWPAAGHFRRGRCTRRPAAQFDNARPSFLRRRQCVSVSTVCMCVCVCVCSRVCVECVTHVIFSLLIAAESAMDHLGDRLYATLSFAVAARSPPVCKRE